MHGKEIPEEVKSESDEEISSCEVSFEAQDDEGTYKKGEACIGQVKDERYEDEIKPKARSPFQPSE